MNSYENYMDSKLIHIFVMPHDSYMTHAKSDTQYQTDSWNFQMYLCLTANQIIGFCHSEIQFENKKNRGEFCNA